MKKILFTILFCLLTSIGFVGCDVENNTNIYIPSYPISSWYWQPYQTNGNGQYGIGGYVAGAPTTRAYAIQSSDVIDNYDSFSLFMWTKDSVLSNAMFNGILNPQQGTWGYEGNQRFFDNNQPRYSFLGILPKDDYTIKADSTVDVSLEDFVTEGVDINAQKYNKEFIVAKTTVEKANYAQGATLNFEHQNSIVRIKFETNNTNNLEILDFTPSVGGTPGSPDQPIYKLKANPIAYIGPSVTDAENAGLTDADIDYINSLFDYYAPHGYNWIPTTQTWAEINPADKHWVGTTLISYWSTNNSGNAPQANSQDVYTQFSGDLSFNVWEYIVNKYPAFATMNISQWENTGNLQSNPNAVMKIVHLYKENGSLHAFMINPSNVTTTQIGVIPGTPATPGTGGKEGIVVLPATSVNQNGKDAVLSTFPETVTANIGLNGVTYTVNTTEQEIIFTEPGTVAYSVYSPTNWYTFPVAHGADFGFTIKFSYTLNGVTRYDARVFVPAAKCNWQPGKWYDYVIKVNSDKHGKTDPTEADEDDPKIEEEFPITVNSSVDQYTQGESHIFEL